MSLIIDTGAWRTRVGLADDEEPKMTISTLYSIEKAEESNNYILGEDLL